MSLVPMMVNLGGQELLEEEYDENFEPTKEEVMEQCNALGIDPETEQDLVYIAREALKAPLPAAWKPVAEQNASGPHGEQTIYYFNFQTGESAWEHPCDTFYRGLLQQERKKKAEKQKENKSKPKKSGKNKSGDDSREALNRPASKSLLSAPPPLPSSTMMPPPLGATRPPLSSTLTGLGATKPPLALPGSPLKPPPLAPIGSSKQPEISATAKALPPLTREKALPQLGSSGQPLSKRKALSFESSMNRTRGSDLFVGEISTHYEEEDEEDDDEEDDDDDDDEEEEEEESDDFLEKFKNKFNILEVQELKDLSGEDMQRNIENIEKEFEKMKVDDKNSEEAEEVEEDEDEIHPATLSLSRYNAKSANTFRPIKKFESSTPRTNKLPPATISSSPRTQLPPAITSSSPSLSGSSVSKSGGDYMMESKEGEIKHHQESIERLKLAHVAELDKLQQQFTKEMQEITKTQNEEKQQQLTTLKKKLDTEQAEEEARLRRLQKEVLASLQDKLKEEEEDEEARLEEAKQDHLRTARRKITQEQEKELADLHEATRKALNEKKQQLAREQKDEEEKLNKSFDAELIKLKNSLAAKAENEKKELEEIERKGTEMKQNHERQVAEMKKSIESTSEEALTRLKQSLSSEHSAALEKLKSSLEKEFEERKASLEEQHELRKAVEEEAASSLEKTKKMMEETHERDKNSLKAQHTSELETLRRNHSTQMEETKQQMEQARLSFVNDHQQKLNELKGECDKELEAKRREIDELKAQSASELEDVKKQLSEQELTSKHAELQQEVTAKTQQRDALQQEILTTQQQLTTLQQGVMTTRQEVTELQQKIGTKHQELANVQQEFMTKQTELRQEVVALQQQLADLQTQVTNTQQQKDTLQQDLAGEQQQLTTVLQLKESLSSQVSALKEEKATLDNAVAVLKKEKMQMTKTSQTATATPVNRSTQTSPLTLSTAGMRSSLTAHSPSSPTISYPHPPAIPSSLSTLSSPHEASSAEEEGDSTILHTSSLNHRTSATPLKNKEKNATVVTADDSQPLDLHDLTDHQSADKRVGIMKTTRQERQQTSGSKQRHRKSEPKKLLDLNHMNVQTQTSQTTMLMEIQEQLRQEAVAIDRLEKHIKKSNEQLDRAEQTAMSLRYPHLNQDKDWVLEDLEDSRTESVTHPSFKRQCRHHFSTNSKMHHDYTAHLHRPGSDKRRPTRYYTPETSDVSSTTSDSDESVHLSDPPQLSLNGSPDSNLSATLEKLSSRIGDVLNRLDHHPVSVASEHVRAPVPAWMPPSLDAGAFHHNRLLETTQPSITDYELQAKWEKCMARAAAKKLTNDSTHLVLPERSVAARKAIEQHKDWLKEFRSSLPARLAMTSSLPKAAY